MKDFYQVLQVSPTATQEEIKKSFRRLALQYHPDKNASPAAIHHYQEIQQAWQTLKDRERRAAYNYQRYINAPLKQSRAPAQNAEEILQLTMAFAKKTVGTDPYRADLDMLYFEARDLLAEHNLALLQPDASVRVRVLELLLPALAVLPFPLADKLHPRLTELAGPDETQLALLKRFYRQSRAAYYWNRYKILFALALAALFCLLLLLAK